jgi:hypothetical protein
VVDATLVIGSDDFIAAVDRVEFLPDVDVEWLPAPFNSGAGTPLLRAVTWDCYLGYAQSTDADSLARYLLQHVGDVKEMVFTPNAAGESVAASVVIVPGGIGGRAGEVFVADAVLPVRGAPEVGP